MSAVNTNLNSMTAQRFLSGSANSLSTAMQRLSSGLRINSAKDDAAGLAISERMTSQVRGLNQAARNANDAISLSQTAEGALASVSNNLQRIRELAVQSANSTNSASDRAALQAEATQLIAENDRVATQTQFNGINLLDGSFTAQQFQVGANAQQTISVASIANAKSSALGQFNGFNGTSLGAITNGAASALTVTLTGPGTVYALGTVATNASAIAAAINAGGVPGLTAVANATAVAANASTTSTGSATGTGILTLNGVNINIGYITGGGAALVQNRSAAVTAINAQSANTGVIATDTGVGVSLAAADGRNIVTSYAAGTATASVITDFGLAAAATTTSTVNATYVSPTGSAVTSVVVNAGAGLAGGTYAVAATGTAMSVVDISTVSGANTALTAVDAALSTINSARASMGAIQNRFQSTISNLQTASENVTAARSRIQDADFAAETANLSRAQILQQAGTAMVAQANQLPQGVLALLR